MKRSLRNVLAAAMALVFVACIALPSLAAKKAVEPEKSSTGRFAVSDVTVNSAKNPAGVDGSVYVGWLLNSPEKNTSQTAYQIVISNGKKPVYDSGKVNSAESAYVPVKMKLKPMTDYKVAVTSWDNHGNKAVGTGVFSSGKVNSKWDAKWITIPEDYDHESPDFLFEKNFNVTKPVKKAVLFSTALGCYVPFLNGKRATQDYFAPGYTQYNKRVQYNTNDVTSQLHQGVNTIITEVAPGWYTGRLGLVTDGEQFGKARALLQELHIVYTDGTEDVVSTDNTWNYSTNGPRRFTSFFDGETYDARYSMTKGPWKKAVEYRGKTPKITEDTGSPVRKGAVVPAKNIGHGIYDFGRNFAGIIHVKLKAPAGRKVHITHAELLKDGKMYRENLRTAKAEVNYTTKDGEQEYEPLFTYMGFRYAQIEAPKGVEIEDVYGTELFSEMEQIGNFETNDKRINQLQKNITTSQKANFIDIPTDCPQRDERSGWTGDISVFSPTGAYNYNMDRFMTKWLTDVRAGQLAAGGIQMVTPTPPKMLPTGVMADSVWGDAILYVPWNVYESTGNINMLTDNYKAMKKWVNYAVSLSKAGKRPYIWENGFHFGDWLAPDTDMQGGTKRAEYTSTCYLAHSTDLLSRIATILGKDGDAKKYQKENQKIKDAFQKYLVGEDGHLKKDFQSAYVLALEFDMLTDAQRPLALNDLVKNIEKNGNHLTTGFVGTPYLLYALSDNGRKDKAYDLLFQDTCPSWLYEVKAGGTSIWERWDGLRPDGTVNVTNVGTNNMVSFNHYAYGCVGDWMYRNSAGIQPLSAGYKKIRIQPLMDKRMTHAKSSHKTPYGVVATNWTNNNGHFTMSVRVPCNTTAEIVLPNGQKTTVGSGTYKFACNVK